MKVPSKAAQGSAGFEQSVCASILWPVLGDGLLRQEGLTEAVHGHTASALEFSRRRYPVSSFILQPLKSMTKIPLTRML